MKSIINLSRYGIIFTITLFICGCKTLLAPEYDKAIVESINKTSEETMSFLSQKDEGTSSIDYTTREQKYNELIGSYDALKIKARARPIPSNSSLEKINELLGKRGTNPISEDYPSAYAFEKISETIKKMKSTDKNQGINKTAFNLFKGQIEVFLDQAITYESFLKR